MNGNLRLGSESSLSALPGNPLSVVYDSPKPQDLCVLSFLGRPRITVTETWGGWN